MRSMISRLDEDMLEAVLNKCSLQDIGRLSMSCKHTNVSCRRWLDRVAALLVPPFCLHARELFAPSKVRFKCTHVGDAFLETLGHACASSALQHCQELHLNHNEISDVGLDAFSTACARGALPRLTLLNLNGNCVGNQGIRSLARACSEQRALPQLWDLWLSGNCIGGDGLEALVAHGAFEKLTSLTLSQNQFREASIRAMAASLCKGALPQLKELYVDGSDVEHPQLQAACVARGIRLAF